MKDTLIIGFACAVAIALGAWLYFSGDGVREETFHTEGPVDFAVVDEGQDSGGLTERKNFRIRSTEEYVALYASMFGIGTEPPSPIPDFGDEEVLALFDGEHATGGYDIELVSVEDTEEKRVVTIRRSSPDASCMTTSVLTSPYLIVRLSASPLPIERIDETVVVPCH